MPHLLQKWSLSWLLWLEILKGRICFCNFCLLKYVTWWVLYVGPACCANLILSIGYFGFNCETLHLQFFYVIPIWNCKFCWWNSAIPACWETWAGSIPQAAFHNANSSLPDDPPALMGFLRLAASCVCPSPLTTEKSKLTKPSTAG